MEGKREKLLILKLKEQNMGHFKNSANFHQNAIITYLSTE